MRIAAETKFSDVVTDLNKLLLRGHYADRNEFAMRAILRESNRVLAVDPAAGWSLLSCYHTLLGEMEEVERCSRAALNLERFSIANEHYHTNVANLGYFSAGHEFFLAVGSPENGMFSRLGLAAFLSGSIQTVLHFLEKATRMNIDMSGFPSSKTAKASAILTEAGLSDEDVVRHLDAAGAVLRRNKLLLFCETEMEVVDQVDLLKGVTCILRVRRSDEEVFELNMALALAEEEMGIKKSPAFEVLFLPV